MRLNFILFDEYSYVPNGWRICRWQPAVLKFSVASFVKTFFSEAIDDRRINGFYSDRWITSDMITRDFFLLPIAYYSEI